MTFAERRENRSRLMATLRGFREARSKLMSAYRDTPYWRVPTIVRQAILLNELRTFINQMEEELEQDIADGVADGTYRCDDYDPEEELEDEFDFDAHYEETKNQGPGGDIGRGRSTRY